MKLKLKNRMIVLAALAWAAVATGGAHAQASAPASEVTASSTGGVIRVDISAQNTPLADVLRAFSVQTGKNIVLGPEVTNNVNLRLTGIPWPEALDVMLRPYGYGYRQVGDTIVVNELAKLQAVQMVEPTVTRVFLLHYLDANDVKLVIEKQLSERGHMSSLTVRGQVGWKFESNAGASGGGGGSSASNIGKRERVLDEADKLRSKTIIVTDIPSVLERIEAILAEVDRMPIQILIEARLMEINVDRLRDIGVELAAASAVRAGGAVFDASAAAGASGVSPAAFDSRSQLSPRQPFDAGLSLLFSQLTDYQWQMFLHLLQEDTSVNVLSSPRILTLNNQEATIIVGTKFPIIRSDVSGQSASISTELDYYENIGIQLNVVPQICEGDYIRMIIHPAVTDQIGTASARTGAGSDIPLTEFPILSTREAETQVLVKSGQTIVIGGLLEDVERKTVLKVPFLGDIPLLGALFRRETKSNQKLDLLIFLTATILTPDELAEHGGKLGWEGERSDLVAAREAAEQARLDAEARLATLQIEVEARAQRQRELEQKLAQADEALAAHKAIAAADLAQAREEARLAVEKLSADLRARETAFKDIGAREADLQKRLAAATADLEAQQKRAVDEVALSRKEGEVAVAAAQKQVDTIRTELDAEAGKRAKAEAALLEMQEAVKQARAAEAVARRDATAAAAEAQKAAAAMAKAEAARRASEEKLAQLGAQAEAELAELRSRVQMESKGRAAAEAEAKAAEQRAEQARLEAVRKLQGELKAIEESTRRATAETEAQAAAARAAAEAERQKAEAQRKAETAAAYTRAAAEAERGKAEVAVREAAAEAQRKAARAEAEAATLAATALAAAETAQRQAEAATAAAEREAAEQAARETTMKASEVAEAARAAAERDAETAATPGASAPQRESLWRRLFLRTSGAAAVEEPDAERAPAVEAPEASDAPVAAAPVVEAVPPATEATVRVAVEPVPEKGGAAEETAVAPEVVEAQVAPAAPAGPALPDSYRQRR